MTVLIFVVIGINLSIAKGLNYATYARRQVISCVAKASACQHKAM